MCTAETDLWHCHSSHHAFSIHACCCKVKSTPSSTAFAGDPAFRRSMTISCAASVCWKCLTRPSCACSPSSLQCPIVLHAPFITSSSLNEKSVKATVARAANSFTVKPYWQPVLLLSPNAILLPRRFAAHASESDLGPPFSCRSPSACR
jgi:hypothetical protein